MIGKIGFIILTPILLLLYSCNNGTDTFIPKKPCKKTGIYCKGKNIYVCENNKYGEGIETIYKKCDFGQICYQEQCISETCDEIVECTNGETLCLDKESYMLCGNFDSDLCMEWQTIKCPENTFCQDGKCISNTTEECENTECPENSHCEMKNNIPKCICNDGYHENEGKCEKNCIPKDCNELSAQCGNINDGCGNNIYCGNCGTNENCLNNKCECKEGYEYQNGECVIDLCANINCENNMVCDENTGNCVCENGYHQMAGECIPDGLCENVYCDDNKHCEEEDGECHPNLKTVNCKPEVPSHGKIDDENKQVEIIWISGHWSEPERCPWHCEEGYEKENNTCIKTQCPENKHFEEEECVPNTKEVICRHNLNLQQNAHDIEEHVTVNWNEDTQSWEEAKYCEWECNENFHKLREENTDTVICVTNYQTSSCRRNENLSPYAIEETNETVTQTWVEDDSYEEGGYWVWPYCKWHCNPDLSCKSSDETTCIEKKQIDECDGEDNNCDGIVDNLPNSGEYTSCTTGDACIPLIHNEHFYLVCQSLVKNWASAFSYCNNLNAHLIVINDEEENEFIKNQITKNYWIGYYQNGNGNNEPWRWTVENNSDYTNWADGEPNNYCVEHGWRNWQYVCIRRENCAEMYQNGKWNDSDCKKKKRFICEFNQEED